MYLSYAARFPYPGHPRHIALAVYFACLEMGVQR